MNRVELLIFKHKDVHDFEHLLGENLIANVYIAADLHTLSETRSKLISLNYTTRLFVTLHDGVKQEFIFGKLKKSKGVFNEHCKNSLIRESVDKVVGISSNEHDQVIVDDRSIMENWKGEREWILVE